MKKYYTEIEELKLINEKLSGRQLTIADELSQLIEANKEVVLLLYSRRCLEVLVREICFQEDIKISDTIPLKGIIDKLNKEQRVPSNIITSMLNLNSSSVYGAHPKEFDTGQVRTALINLAGILKWFIDYKEIHESAQPLPQPRSVTLSPSKGQPQSHSKKSIIVLPFENMSSDPEQEYFSDGLTEEIITDLSYIHDLLVISRSSAMTFKGTKHTIKEIAQKVNVTHVLEGSVRKAGNKLRIIAQLIEAESDTHLWAEKYDGVLDDIFEIHENVAKSIAESLKIKLSISEIEKYDKRKSGSSVAYEQYLYARQKIWLGSKESVQQAIESLENNLNVIGKDEYLLVALGLAYFQYINAGLDTDSQNLTKADEYIKQAIKINKLSSKAFYVKGMIHETKGEINEAFAAIKKSLELNNNDSEALMVYAFLSGLVGHPEIGKSFAEKAVENDPLNPWVYFGKWWIYLSEGRLDEQENIALQIYSLGEKAPPFLWHYGYSLALNRNFTKSILVFEQLTKDYSNTIFASLSRVFLMAFNKEIDEMKRALSKLNNIAENDHLFAWYFAQVCSYANEKEIAMNYLERATKDIFINYPLFNKIDPLLEKIRGEEHFKNLMKKVKHQWENFNV